MKRWLVIKKSVWWTTVWFLFALVPRVHGQDNSTASEVYLSFQYRGVVSNYVTTYYKDKQFYLPVSELFNLLKIPHEVNQGNLSITGYYLGEKQFKFDFKNQVAQAGDTQIKLTADDFLIKDIDYFVRPEIFEKLFGLKFATDFNNLTLDLETADKMPVVAQYEREQKREQLNRQKPIYNRTHYPLKYDRHYGTVDGAFLDYNVSGVYTNNSQLLTFSNSIGAELLGGDVQGNLFGAFSDQQSSFTTSGLRWRYVQRNSPIFSSAIAGQTNTEGITNRSITGVKLTNKPVESRLLFDRYVINGDATPQSEVELYLNNQLVDYQKVDQSGNYRFTVPLTYGSTDYSVRIYTPAGQEIDRDSRIQIPFDYLPPGRVDYTLSGGQLENPILGSTERGYIGAAAVSAGLANWLTAKVSSEYLTNYHSNLPSVTGTLNARLFSNYLVSANFNSENFYSLTSSVVYNNGASWTLEYDYNPGNSRLYNVGGYDQQARINLFTPFRLGAVPLNIRWSSSYQKSGGASLLRYRADLNTRLGRLNVRLGYQDQQAGDLSLITTSSSRLTNSYTYSMGRFSSVPGFLRGMFIRGQLTYLPGLKQFEETEFQLSRDIKQTGQLQFTFGHNFIGDFNSLSLNFTIDLGHIRSNTTSRTSGSDYSITQNFRGSIGYDPYGDQLLFENRQQVGQSGAAVRLFVDKNNDGTYEDSTDNVITDPAVHLNRAGGRTNVKNGINYISQLLPYYRYDIEINKSALSNPLLVPNVENFSIVTDPNQYKTIEIPFYQSGVISGKVTQKKDSTSKALSGVRLYLKSNYDKASSRKPFSKELRTFSDGSFYTYEIPPGKYNLYIDPKQLDFLGGISKPDTMKVTIKSLADGDFVEGLDFTVISKGDSTKSKSVVSQIQKDTTSVTQKTEIKKASDEFFYKIQLASFHTLRKAEQVAAEASRQLGGSFSVTQNTQNGLYAIRSAPIAKKNDAFETIISYHNGTYTNAALVVLKNKFKDSDSVKSTFIQIGAFNSIKGARDFANSAANELGKELAITYNQEIGLYKVYINESYSSRKKMETALSHLQQDASYKNAVINDQERIQLGTFRSWHQAKVFADNSEAILKQPVILNKNSAKNYNVILNENYESKTELQSAFNRIKKLKPFHSAFINHMPDRGDVVKEKQRAMNFTFQIRLENVSDESAEASLKKVLGPSDTTLEHPHKGIFIFDNISSWHQAQELQKELQKLSTGGHPIVVLIEQNPSWD